MQTFLPYPDFAKSAEALDRQRLGKQRSEALTLLATNLGQSGLGHSWVNHPAAVMWRGYEGALFRYAMIICIEWTGRGYADGIQARLVELMGDAIDAGRVRERMNLMPHWLGAPGFHLSHRSNLIRKDPEFYRRCWPDDPDCLDYVWPKYRPDLQGEWQASVDVGDSPPARADALESSEGPAE